MDEPQMAATLLPLADRYEAPHLKTRCDTVLSRDVDADNAVDYVILAHLHGCPALKRRCLRLLTRGEFSADLSVNAESMKRLKTYPDLLTEMVAFKMNAAKK